MNGCSASTTTTACGPARVRPNDAARSTNPASPWVPPSSRSSTNSRRAPACAATSSRRASWYPSVSAPTTSSAARSITSPARTTAGGSGAGLGNLGQVRPEPPGSGQEQVEQRPAAQFRGRPPSVRRPGRIARFAAAEPVTGRHRIDQRRAGTRASRSASPSPASSAAAAAMASSADSPDRSCEPAAVVMSGSRLRGGAARPPLSSPARGGPNTRRPIAAHRIARVGSGEWE